MRSFYYNDIEIRYKTHGGQGPLVIALHGFGGGPTDFQELIPILESKARIVPINLKTFFSHAKPVSFKSQVSAVADLVVQLAKELNLTTYSLMGQSFGGTLSFALRLELARKNLNVQSHLLFNPMPFNPLDNVLHPLLKLFVGFGYIPGGVAQFIATERGRKSLVDVAKIFRIGSFGHHDVHHFNARKLQLVEKALRRFQWIDQNENWSHWESQVPQDKAKTYLFYSTKDPLFSVDHYQGFVKKIPGVTLHPIEHEGHLLVQDLPPANKEFVKEIIS